MVKHYDQKQPVEEFILVCGSKGSTHNGKGGRTVHNWLEQETMRSNLPPQTQTEESKLEVGQWWGVVDR